MRRWMWGCEGGGRDGGGRERLCGIIEKAVYTGIELNSGVWVTF